MLMRVKQAKKYIEKVIKSILRSLHYLLRAFIGLLAYLLPKLYSTSILIIRYLKRKAKKYYKILHKKLAVQTHSKLLERYAWYALWHNKKYHKQIHAGILTAYSTFVLLLLITSFRGVMALSDLTTTWDFSTASDYSYDAGVEVTQNKARFKAQNYTTDANTKALYHFDETSGSTAADDSGNSNNATVDNSTFGSGNLNNSIQLNGTTSSILAPDSRSLSLSQANTLEGWAKFNSPFSAGSSDQRQGVVDKGDYQLYFDNETGKATYELANNSANSWTKAGGDDTNGSWDTNGKRSVNAYAKMGSDIYAGIGVDTGDAEVWKWDGTNWSQIGGGANGINGSWAGNTYEGVYALATDGSHIYAGLGNGTGDGEVWEWNGSTWTKVGGDSVNSGWTNYAQGVYSLDYFGGKLNAPGVLALSMHCAVNNAKP